MVDFLFQGFRKISFPFGKMTLATMYISKITGENYFDNTVFLIISVDVIVSNQHIIIRSEINIQ